MKRTRVGIVGFGVMGARHARVFGALDSDFEIAGALEPNGSKMPSFLRHFMRLEDLIDACDLVVVANPIEAHAKAVMLALERGRHVLVEKPIAATAEGAMALVDRARAAGVNLFVGHSERFHPVVQALVTHLAVNAEKPIDFAFRRIATGTPRDASLRSPEEDALLNLAVHDIDLAMFLGGGNARLRGASGHRGCASVDLSTETWAAEIFAGRSAEAERSFEIETETFRYRGDLRTPSLVVSEMHAAPITIELSTEEPLAAQAAAVAASLRGERSSVATGEDGARAVAVAEQALSLLRQPLKAAENL